MEDKEIVRLYWDRNELAIKETSLKYGGYCYTIAYHILLNREDADESVNDAYMRIWECIPPHFPEVLSVFVGKITRRVSLDKWRTRTGKKRAFFLVFLNISCYTTLLLSEKQTICSLVSPIRGYLGAVFVSEVFEKREYE